MGPTAHDWGPYKERCEDTRGDSDLKAMERERLRMEWCHKHRGFADGWKPLEAWRVRQVSETLSAVWSFEHLHCVLASHLWENDFLWSETTLFVATSQWSNRSGKPYCFWTMFCHSTSDLGSPDFHVLGQSKWFLCRFLFYTECEFMFRAFVIIESRQKKV